METLLPALTTGTEAVILRLAGGSSFRKKIGEMGLREGVRVRLVAKHLLGGPIVIEVSGREITLGRGMAAQIVVTVPAT
ncbi:MAG: ferrous iron transport protein A [Methanospirillum sp.]|nr:ferrous iron transport protein A [Methanospirillum sp.]